MPSLKKKKKKGKKDKYERKSAVSNRQVTGDHPSVKKEHSHRRQSKEIKSSPLIVLPSDEKKIQLDLKLTDVFDLPCQQWELGKPVITEKMKWYLEVGKQFDEENGQPYLVFFTYCVAVDENVQSLDWRIYCKLTFQILPAQMSIPPIKRVNKVFFSKDVKAHGHFTFHPWNNIISANNHYLKKDKIDLRVIVEDIEFLSRVKVLPKNICQIQEDGIVKEERLEELAADIHFILDVGNEVIYAHSKVLSNVSPEWTDFLVDARYGCRSAKTVDSILQINMHREGIINPLSFKAMLLYIYQRKLFITKEITAELFQIADRFGLPVLKTFCCEDFYSLPDCSVVEFLEYFANKYWVPLSERKDNIEEYLDRLKDAKKDHTQFFAFYTRNISLQLLKLLIQSNSFNVTEEKIFSWVWDWAHVRNPGYSGLELRDALGDDVISSIRFPIMDKKFFNNSVIPTGLLKSNEVQNVHDFWEGKTKECLFNTSPRVT